MLVYLDQNYWGRLMLPDHRALLAHLSALAESGKGVFPVSAIHVLETMKAPADVRRPLFELMADLSCGWCLKNPISAMRLEFDRNRRALDLAWIKDNLLTKNPIEMLGPTESIAPEVFGAVIASVDLKLFLDLLNNVGATKETAMGLNAVLSRGASGLNGLHGRVPVDQAGVAFMLGISPESLPFAKEDLLRIFPSLRVRTSVSRAIVDARPTGAERNDVTDLAFLSTAVPYFDVVTVDRRMGVRITEASKPWPFPHEVVSDIGILGDVLKARVAG